ncbi:MAG TPA: transglycosylase SLT domain-containing protein [Thermoanaerobaculia bacterium]|nr:transglycosylase SLT domain-containing protein [Thermoanaerobaculia bacterium]
MKRLVWVAALVVACSKTAPTPPPPPAAAPPAVTVSTPPPAPVSLTPREQARAALAMKGDDAVKALMQAADTDPIVAPWLRLRIASLTQNKDEAIAALRTIIQETPASSAAVTARIRLAALVPEAYSDTASIPIDEFTEEEFVKLAKARADVANAVRMRLLTEYPQGRFTEQTYDFIAKASPSPLDALNFDDSLRIANQLANRDRYDQALDLFKRIAARFPNANTQAAYRAARMRALFHSRHYTELLAEPKPTDPALQLVRARAAWRVGQNDEFLKGLAQIIDAGGKEKSEALLLRSKYYTSDDPRLDLATRDLQDAIDAGNLGSDGENLWTLGWTYFLAKRFDDALQTFDKYQQRYPDGDYLSNSLFWSGKIYDRLGDRVKRDAKWHELEAKYPYGYFSYRARELAGEAPVAPSEVANGNVFPNIDALIASANDPRLDAVRELAAIGLYAEATAEMKRVAAAYPTNQGLAFMLADLYVQAGQPFAANNVLQRRFRDFVRHGGSGVPHRFWEILFPLAYWDSIKSEAEKRQLDPYLIAAISRQESGFEPSTVSNAGAVGIMQIMPAEATAIATEAGLPAPSREQLFDPATNIAIGAAEFSQKLARTNGKLIPAIAAYNAGEDAVGKWTAQTPVDDVDLFVESIPYAETRLYVKTVSRNRFEYRRIYENAARFSPPAAPQ